MSLNLHMLTPAPRPPAPRPTLIGRVRARILSVLANPFVLPGDPTSADRAAPRDGGLFTVGRPGYRSAVAVDRIAADVTEPDPFIERGAR